MDSFCLNIHTYDKQKILHIHRPSVSSRAESLYINSLFLEATLFLLFPQIETRPNPPGKCLRQVTMSFLIPLSVLRQAMWEISGASFDPPRSRFSPQIIIISPVKIPKQKTKLKIFLNFFTARLGYFTGGCTAPRVLLFRGIGEFRKSSWEPLDTVPV